MTTVYLLIGLWVAFNLIAPYAVLLRAERVSWGRLPAELLMGKQDKKVRFYITSLNNSYGYSVFSPFLNLVVFDKRFFANASPSLMRFVIAHEIAHFRNNHHKKRWFAVITGAVLFPFVRRWLLRMEDEADAEATLRTGFDRKLFSELGGGHGRTKD